MVQAPALARLVEGGLPTEALIAQVIVAKYAAHLPLYRQGIDLDRSSLGRTDAAGRGLCLYVGSQGQAA